MTQDQIINEIAGLISRVIEGLGSPVGMGIPPHPGTMLRLAAEIVKIARQPIAEEQPS
jgi:hypothetical protein